MSSLLSRAYALRQEVGTFVPIHSPKLDVKDAYRRIHIEWEKAPISYAVEGLLVVDCCMAFRWQNLSGWWSLMA